jgi:four helix bundle protein
VSDFKKLHVWQKAHALSLCVDRVCKQIRGSRYASLRSQLFRAATSIPANIAEGRRQESEKEFARFLRYALTRAQSWSTISFWVTTPGRFQTSTSAR